jgi:DNA-binding transcriptional ArsR family regulator
MRSESTDDDVLKALNHSVRRQVMSRLGEGMASPKELAAALGIPISTVSYHVGILRDLGLIEIARETPRRGAVERHYQSTSYSLSVRDVIGWFLAAHQSSSRSWNGRIVGLDSEGDEAVRAALADLWIAVDEAEQGSVRRSASVQADALVQHGVAIVMSPLGGG